MKHVDVVGAVIRNEAGEILCALRSPAMAMAGLWEFPGGKIEPGEAPEVTLRREIVEELGCDIAVGELIEDVTYAYPNVEVRLLTYFAAVVSGHPVAREHAELRWVPLIRIHELEWAPADVPTVERLVGGG